MKNCKLPLPLQEQEALIARNKLQQRILRNFGKQIFENINQVLCLARIKLVNLDMEDKTKMGESLEQSGDLIGQAIHDLRKLAKQVKKYD